MVSKATNTGDAGSLVITITDGGGSASGNYTDVDWSAALNERTEYNFSSSGGTPATITVNGVVVWNSTFSWSWLAGGLQNKTIASGTLRVNHNADGTKTVSASVAMAASGTAGAGGPTTSSVSLALPTRTVLPSVPASVTVTRVSDTQTKVAWTNAGASNGKATQNIVQMSTDGGAYVTVATISAAGSTTITTAANHKYTFKVAAKNAAGTTAYSAATSPIYTTPAAPSALTAIKNASLNIVVSFAENVNYSEYVHEVWHGTVSGGVTTWDGAALATLATGVLTYTHSAPNASQVHIYQVRAKTASGTALYSPYVISEAVQLLVAPNKPNTIAMPATADKAQPLDFAWTHNPVDSTLQTAYEFQRSTDGGTTWPTTTGKVASAAQVFTVPASTYAGNVALTTRVRTWGAATSGGSDGLGASPWSDLRTVTFKSIPVTTITTPAAAAVLNDSVVRVTLSFTQAEAATFVKAKYRLLTSADVLLEEKESTSRTAVPMATPVLNGGSYKISAQVQDSNGLWSAWVTNAFTVTYLPAPPATVSTVYLEDTGFGQVNIVVPAPGAGQSATATLTVYRDIDGVRETVLLDYPATTGADLAVLDTTATIHGTNTYTIISTTALGAQTPVTIDLVTTELKRAFLSKGTDYSIVGVFGGNLSVEESLGVASATIQAAGRTKPVGLYGTETSVALNVSSYVFEGFGSTVDELRKLLLLPGEACYRDASGRRMFGSAVGGLSYVKDTRATLSFTITETS